MGSSGLSSRGGEISRKNSSGHVYGFHDLQGVFATMNADKLTPGALQTLMRHKGYQTTQSHIDMARQMDAAVASLHVHNVLRQRRQA
jgi:hypothetical protein